jgi:hypothetical protein
MKLFTMQHFQASYYFIPFRSKYSQHTILKYVPSVCVLPLMSVTKLRIHTKVQARLEICIL